MDRYFQENIVKGIANHRRIEILYTLASQPDLSVEEIAEVCSAEYKTIAMHLHRLAQSGLITKKYFGRRVEHRLTERGTQALDYLRCLT